MAKGMAKGMKPHMRKLCSKPSEGAQCRLSTRLSVSEEKREESRLMRPTFEANAPPAPMKSMPANQTGNLQQSIPEAACMQLVKCSGSLAAGKALCETCTQELLRSRRTVPKLCGQHGVRCAEGR